MGISPRQHSAIVPLGCWIEGRDLPVPYPAQHARCPERGHTVLPDVNSTRDAHRHKEGFRLGLFRRHLLSASILLVGRHELTPEPDPN